MARRRHSFGRRARAAVRYVGRKVRRHYGHKSAGSPLHSILNGAIYGVARGPVANLASPLTSALPLGNYSTNAAMLLISYLVAKKGGGMLGGVGRAGLVVEGAALASTATSGMFGGGSSGGAF